MRAEPCFVKFIGHVDHNFVDDIIKFKAFFFVGLFYTFFKQKFDVNEEKWWYGYYFLIVGALLNLYAIQFKKSCSN